MHPEDVYRDVYRLLTTNPCIAHWDDEGDLHIEPLTHEEATVLARDLTVYIVSTFTERPTAA